MRPSKEDVDAALAGTAAYEGDGDASHNESVLAAEVLALREELADETAHREACETKIAEYEVTMKRAVSEWDATPRYSTVMVDALLADLAELAT